MRRRTIVVGLKTAHTREGFQQKQERTFSTKSSEKMGNKTRIHEDMQVLNRFVTTEAEALTKRYRI